MKKITLFFTLSFLFFQMGMAQDAWNELQYSPNQKNIEYNPLKGLMPSFPGVNNNFPSSTEKFYIPLNQVFKDWNTYDWKALEDLMNKAAAKGHHCVPRFYIDYPNRPYALPEFLRSSVTSYNYTEHGNTTSKSPDYKNETLIRALEEFIAAFGLRYNNDPRMGFIDVGLYGFWGEWHVYRSNPDNRDFEMPQASKDRLLQAYLTAFPNKKLMVRDAEATENNSLKNAIGYYDDSFGLTTLNIGWGFWPKMERTGLTNSWKTHPMAGEVHPSIKVDKQYAQWPYINAAYNNNFEECIRTTHATIMANHGVFSVGSLSNTQYANALRATKLMGYQFFVKSVKLSPQSNNKINVELNIQNRGVAPFYYNWQVELGAINTANGNFNSISTANFNLTEMQPSSNDYYRSVVTNVLAKGDYKIVMRVKNPLKDRTSAAKPLRFANSTQDADRNEWITLGSVKVGSGSTTVSATGVSVTPDKLTLNINKAGQLSATVQPSNATTKSVNWTSNNTAIATVDSSGKITGKSVGNVVITAKTTDGGFTDTAAITVTASTSSQTAYKDSKAQIPGTIEGEYYDEGGQGVAFNDDGTKSGEVNFRVADKVDVVAKSSGSNGYAVGYSNTGEWLEYTLNATSGNYDITLYYFCGSTPGDLKISLDGTALSTIKGMNNKGWGTQQSITVKDVSISGGNSKVLRLAYANGAGFDIDALVFTKSTDPTPSTNLIKDGTYTLLSKSGAYLTATTSAAVLKSISAKNGAYTSWTFKHLGDEVYEIRSAQFQGQRVELPNAVSGYRAKIAITAFGGSGDFLKWKASKVGSYFIFEPLHNIGFAMDAHVNDPNVVHLWKKNSNNGNQLFTLSSAAGTSDLKTSTDSAAAIGESMNLYPNPVSSTLNIDFPDADMEREIRIFNLSGQLVYSEIVSGKSASIALGQIGSKGLLTVQIVSGQQVSSHKIILR